MGPSTQTAGSEDPSPSIDELRLALEQASRRESQLQGLLRTAQRLLADAEPDELLGVVVDAAQSLCGSDVAHLNLRQPGGAFSLHRATAGAFSKEFKDQRTPEGYGLSGLVMRMRAPYVTHDYLNDERIAHTPSSDSSIRADGLVTMAGVPLLDGIDIVGVLIVSWRRRAPVSSEDLALMDSLASLATLAIGSAKQAQAKESAIRDLESANDLIRQNSRQREWSEFAHDQLTSALLKQRDLSALSAALFELFHGSHAYFLDGEGRLISAAPQHGAPPDLPVGLLQEVRTSGRLARFVDGASTYWVAPATSGSTLLGVLVLKRGSLNEVEARTLERAGMMAALLLMTQRWRLETEFKSSAEVVNRLVAGVQLESAASRAESLGLDVTRPCVVLATSILARHAQGKESARYYAHKHGGIAGERDGTMIVLVPGTDAEQVANDFASHLTRIESDCIVGGGGPSRDAGSIQEAYRQASMCVIALRRLGQHGPTSLDSLGFIGVLIGAEEPGISSAYVDRTIGPLREYDDTHGSHLLETLAAYLRRSGSLQEAASDLHVHANTVLQRLRRAGELLGVDLHNYSVLLEIQIALRLHSISPEAIRSIDPFRPLQD